MDVQDPTQEEEDGSEESVEFYQEEEIINSMIPIWKKNKNELKPEDYENFYAEKHFGFDKPLKYAHINAEGTISYRAILYIPEKMPYAFYTKEYEKGLELYSNGVLIMNKCAELVPDYFSFVKGVVDSEDLSLNISRKCCSMTGSSRSSPKTLSQNQGHAGRITENRAGEV